MSNDRSPPIDDSDSLRTALAELLTEARDNDVEIEGALRVKTPDADHSDWEIQIWKVER